MSALTMSQGPPAHALRRGESDFRLLLEGLPAGAYTCDASGLITFYNTRMVEMWGREPGLNDPGHRYCGSFRLLAVDGTPIEHDESWMALALRHDRVYDAREMIIERPDARRVTVLAYAHPLHDECGRLCGAVNVLVDISERKAAEEGLRTAHCDNDEFLATLAHELRNPLAPLRNAVQILNLKVPPTPDTTAALSVIDRQMTQMTRLIDDLTDLSRITRNKLQLQKKQVKLADVVHVALETSQPLIEADGHRFTLQMPAEPITLEADAPRLTQVVSNLLNNAAKFTPRGGHITLKVEREGDEAVLRVHDTGIGIAPEALPDIFEMFTQVGHTFERNRAGLGVGLTLVRRLVELHGGSIEARSEGRNLGAEFVIRLPAAPRTGTRARSASSVSGRDVQTTSLRILVVDDNVDAAVTMAELLAAYGHDVRTAFDGVEGLEEANRFKPDVVILDIGMPKMNGYTVAARIRERMNEAQPLLIAVTGWGQDEDRRRSKAAGFDHHLVKPVDPSEVIELLRARPGDRTLH